MEVFLAVLILLLLVCLIAGPILGLLALLAARRLQLRLDELERQLRRAGAPAQPPESYIAQAPPAANVAERPPPPPIATMPKPQPVAASRYAEPKPAFNLEAFLGKKALGWVAAVLLLFGVAFFLRYAFQNYWIGPMGQVSLGVLAGAALVVLGWWFDRCRGMWRFAQIVTSAGLLLLYLAAYASCGYFTILTRDEGGLFLLLIVAGGALLAVLYNARALALMTVLGGLLVPLLLHSTHDRYQQLFIYLLLLNAGVLLAAYWRHWSVVSLAALAGTHCLFWIWYFGNYHPEKLAWALGFQAALLILFLRTRWPLTSSRGGGRASSTWSAWR